MNNHDFGESHRACNNIELNLAMSLQWHSVFAIWGVVLTGQLGGLPQGDSQVNITFL